MKNSMEDFNAEQARQLVDSYYSDELHNVLVEIKLAAEVGKSFLHIYEHQQPKTIQSLRDRGFRVIDHPGIAIQRDSLYYTINWD